MARKSLDPLPGGWISEREAAELLGWDYRRLQRRRQRALDHGDPDHAPPHELIGDHDLIGYHVDSVVAWMDAHRELFDSDELLEPARVAQVVGVSSRTLATWRTRLRRDPSSDAHPPWVMVEQRPMVLASELEAWMQRRTQRRVAAALERGRRDT